MLRSLTAAALIATGTGPAPAQDVEFFTIASGSIAGGYYSAARAICDTINRSGAGAVRCSPDPTSGSIYNLDALREGHVDFALVQSDWQRQAVEGTGPFAEAGPMTGLRSVMGLYPEAITVLARGGLEIETAGDLLGRRVDIGHPSSGRYATNQELFDLLDITASDFAFLAELPVGSVVDELCAGRIDASLLIVGHPNGEIARALMQCDAVLVPVSGPAIDTLLDGTPDYSSTVIPASAYRELDRDVPTFAVTATIVTLARTDEATVSRLADRVIEDLPGLARAAPVLSGLTPGEISSRGLTAPLHPGAEAVYSATGVF
jgi:TRAP transporter TAXI family solute receptor